MFKRVALLALLAASTGSAAAQAPSADTIYNQLVTVYANSRGILKDSTVHYVITLDVRIPKADMADLGYAVMHGHPDVVEPIVVPGLGTNPHQRTAELVQAVIDAIGVPPNKGSPPDVDIQTLDDATVQGANKLIVEGTRTRPVTSRFRIHLDIPITKNLDDLRKALSEKNGCKASTYVKVNVAIPARTPLVSKVVNTALACPMDWP